MEVKIFMTTSLTLALVVTINCLYVCCLTCQIKSGLIRLTDSREILTIPQKERNVDQEKNVVEGKNEEEKEKCAAAENVRKNAEENARKNVVVVDEMRKKTLRERRNVNLKLDLSEISAKKPKRCAKVLRDLNLKSEADFDQGLQGCTKGMKDLNIKSEGDLNIKSEDAGDRGLEMAPFRPRAYQF